MSTLVIKLPAHADQTEFNLARWEELLADSFLASLDQRIETDRHGHIVMWELPLLSHSRLLSETMFAVKSTLPNGHTQLIAPISTADGIKVCDVTWASPQRHSAIEDRRAYLAAPDVCVEVLAASDTTAETTERKALYFHAGAREVWFCRDDGVMEFYLTPEGGARPMSALCPEFPGSIPC